MTEFVRTPNVERPLVSVVDDDNLFASRCLTCSGNLVLRCAHLRQPRNS